MAKPQLRLQARLYRKDGDGIKTIAHRLKVSSSTVSIWCKDISLSESQIVELERRSRDPYYGQRLIHLKKLAKKRESTKKRLFNKCATEIGQLSKRDLFIAGIALYWAEGFKKDTQVGFSNSDPNLISLWINWLEKCLDIPRTQLRFRVGLNESYKNVAMTIERYWQEELGVKADQFQKPFFQKVVWKKIYDHPEQYHGVLRIRVRKSSELLTKIKGWISALPQ